MGPGAARSAGARPADAASVPCTAGELSPAISRARFDIIELGAEPIGRIVVDRPPAMVHIVDQAIVPALRNRGIGTAIMRALMAEARQNSLLVRLKVASSNDPSMRPLSAPRLPADRDGPGLYRARVAPCKRRLKVVAG